MDSQIRLNLRFFVLMIRPPPTSTLSPYTTLFRSRLRTSARRWFDRHRRALPVGFDPRDLGRQLELEPLDRKSTRLNSSHANISYAVFCLKKKKKCVTILS